MHRFLDFEITGGHTILDDTEDGFRSASSTVFINSISETEIEIEFTFEREDGETIKGNFSGEYSVLNN
ncbi:hypothetical protein [Psychroflexus tropicus]|uniref:hypothetical protein n=1 Tax=Psychroflexus tropicus TaxID=197345 RepID=UPI0003999DD3|nr:hypothetical protein [Psychroflexus tropicus]